MSLHDDITKHLSQALPPQNNIQQTGNNHETHHMTIQKNS